MPLSVGTKLDEYEVLGLLGAGGMGEVYRARDGKLKREVAIKVLPSFVSQDAERLRRFQQEAQATAALNHPNILAVHEMGSFAGTTYLVTELLEGETLRQEMAHGALPMRKAIDYGTQIARGLAAAHEKGIVHRDLKPENIFVTRDERVKILDFGLAKLTEVEAGSKEGETASLQTTPGQVMGTVGYMAPEQVRGESVDYRADIFAFGAMLYEMLAQQRAFKKPTTAETMAAILNEEPPNSSQIAPGTSLALVRIVQRCLEKKPERRFQSAADLAFALEAISETSGTQGIVREPSARQSRQNWMWPVVLALPLAAGLLAWWRMAPAAPVVESVTQLTDDGEPKDGQLVSDGSRVYFNEGPHGSWKIAQVGVSGGRTSLVDTRVVDPWVAGLASDNAWLLALSGGYEDARYALWSIPIPAGEPRRLSGAAGNDASFFPDGRIVFADFNDLYVAEKDGSNVRKLVSLDGIIEDPKVSPDGKHISCTLYSRGWITSALVEMASDGSGVRTILSSKGVQPCCGQWSPDGKYLLYGTAHRQGSDLWALPMRQGFLGRVGKPVSITAGPLEYSGAGFGRDGNVFAIGAKRRSELIYYDSKTHQFQPFLGGISAIDPTFSKDGQWVAYTAYPDHTLWRSRVGGTERTQLTYAPTKVQYPFISPDGSKVCFTTSQYEVFIVGANGGPEQKVAEHSAGGNWAPDGSSLVFTSFTGYDMAAEQRHQPYLQIFDLATQKTTVVPSSQNRFGGSWLTPDTLVAAESEIASGDTGAGAKLLTFDVNTQKWAELIHGSFVAWALSPDRQYLYFTTGGAEPKAQRLRFSDRQVETITSLKEVRRVVDELEQNTQIDVAADGSLILARDIGTEEIYAIRLRWPSGWRP
jgi:serine/threonine protein kinase/WD40 repeat protein